MARLPDVETLSRAELMKLRDEVDRAILAKQAEERAAVRARLAEVARAQGFSLDEVLGKTGKRGPVAVKFRDPRNPENTWTGRGRTPRWMVAAMQGGRVSKEDFLV